jgi:hypothetical protein
MSYSRDVLLQEAKRRRAVAERYFEFEISRPHSPEKSLHIADRKSGGICWIIRSKMNQKVAQHESALNETRQFMLSI